VGGRNLASACCPFGRPLDEMHPTCVSCRRQQINCRQTSHARLHKKQKQPVSSYPVGEKLICIKDLRTPNDWTNKEHGKLIYARERREWEKCLRGSLFLWGKATSKRYLMVTRYIRDARDLIRDQTNREGALKPLEDALVRAGVLVDDRDEFLVREPLKQEIDRSFPRVEICIRKI
jgi:hypothetical protein